MSISGTNSYFGIGRQANRTTRPVAYNWVEAFAPAFTPAPNTKVRRPHIGGSPFARGAYQAGIVVPFSAQFEATSDMLGTTLASAAGQSQTGAWFRLTVPQAVTAFTIGNGSLTTASINHEASPDQVKAALVLANIYTASQVFVSKIDASTFYIASFRTPKPALVTTGTGGTTTITEVTSAAAHKIAMDTSNNFAQPWMGVYRGIPEANIHEIAVGAKIANMGINVVGGDAVTAQLAGMGLRYERLSALPTGSYDNSDIMTGMAGQVSLYIPDPVTPSTVNEYGTINGGISVLGAQIQMASQLTPADRYGVGSSELIGLDVLARALTIQISFEIDDAALYDRILRNGNVWRNVPVYGSARIGMANGDSNVHASELVIPNALFSGTMAVAQPQEMVMGQITATVMQNEDGNIDEFYWLLYNENTTGYSVSY